VGAKRPAGCASPPGRFSIQLSSQRTCRRGDLCSENRAAAIWSALVSEEAFDPARWLRSSLHDPPPPRRPRPESNESNTKKGQDARLLMQAGLSVSITPARQFTRGPASLCPPYSLELKAVLGT